MRTMFGPGAAASAEIILYETANHGLSAWSYFLAAIVRQYRDAGGEPADLVPCEPAEALANAEARWREADRLPAMWKAPTSSN